MAVTLTRTQVGPCSWKIEAASGLSTPTYYWYLDGYLIEATTRNFRVFTLAPGEQSQIEVFDSDTDVPQVAYSGRVVITWDAVADAVSYKVEQKIAGDWTQKAVIQDANANSFMWRSAVLADDTTHEVRITATDTNGIESTARELSAHVVRRPDAVSVSYIYDSETQKITAAVA